MKAFIEFIGETRHPKTGDLIMCQSGAIAKVSVNHTHVVFPIVTRHEIDIPDGANILTVQTRGTCNTLPAIHFPIPPRPKKKVKKWWWNVEDDNASDGFSTSGPYTEEEIKQDYPNAKWYHRIDETMVEVVK